jgi:hypothetical protein
MKSYQDPDALHGHGKAVPKPKQPTPNTQRILVNRYITFSHAYNGMVPVGKVRLTRNGNTAQPAPVGSGL